MVNGILFVDKDEEWTSHDAVAKARRVLGTRKVGHAGTLDPMATGLLTLGAGPSTRLLTHMVGLDKTYTATIRLGEATLSDDRMSDVTETAPEGAVEALTAERIEAAVELLRGDITQVPSKVSAIRVDGKRSYDRVRSGEEVELKGRPVTIFAFVVHELRQAKGSAGQPVLDLDVTVHCSSGTYIRALARDLGSELGVGGHLTALRRTAVGPFRLADHRELEAPLLGDEARASRRTPVTVDAVTTKGLADGHGAESAVTPTAVARALFDVIELDEQRAIDLSNGKRPDADRDDVALAAAVGPEEWLVGLVSVVKGRIKAVTNFPAPSTNEKGQQ